MRDEGKHILAATDEINRKPRPDVPMLLFVSDGSETGGESRIHALKEYAASLTDAKTVNVDCGHAIYAFKPKQRNDKIRASIESRTNKNQPVASDRVCTVDIR